MCIPLTRTTSAHFRSRSRSRSTFVSTSRFCQLPGSRRRHRHQPQRRLRRPLAQKSERMFKTPKCIGKFRVNQQRIHRQPSQERVAARARSEGSGRVSLDGSKCGPARSGGLVPPPFSHQNAYSARKIAAKPPQPDYSGSPIGVERNRCGQVAFSDRGPRRQILVAGVEVNATLLDPKTPQELETRLKTQKPKVKNYRLQAATRCPRYNEGNAAPRSHSRLRLRVLSPRPRGPCGCGRLDSASPHSQISAIKSGSRSLSLGP